MPEYEFHYSDQREGRAIDVVVKEPDAEYQTRRFAKAFLDTLARTDITAMDKNIMTILGMLAQKTGKAYPSVRTIAMMIGASVDTVERRLQILVKDKNIVKEHRFDDKGRQLSNFYSLPPASCPPSADCGREQFALPQNALPIRQEQIRLEEGKKEHNTSRIVPVFSLDKGILKVSYPEGSCSTGNLFDDLVTYLEGPNGPESPDRTVLNGGDSRKQAKPAESSPNRAVSRTTTYSAKSIRSKDVNPPPGTPAAAVELVKALAVATDAAYPGCRFAVSIDDYGFAINRIKDNPNAAAKVGEFLKQFEGKVSKKDYESRKLVRFSAFSIWLMASKKANAVDALITVTPAKDKFGNTIEYHPDGSQIVKDKFGNAVASADAIDKYGNVRKWDAEGKEIRFDRNGNAQVPITR